MKRRQLIRYGGISMATAIATGVLIRPPAIAQDTDGVTIQYLGHTCFLFTGNGLKVLVNPYQSVGCTAGYSLPDLQPDVVLVSSFLLDEGRSTPFKAVQKSSLNEGCIVLAICNFKVFP